MVSLGNFDATQVEPQGDRSPLPAGEYRVAIISSEMKPTKNGSGQFLELVLEVLEGQYKGRRLWDRLNLVNQNSQAVEIARSTLSAICHATGKLQPKDSGELHSIPMIARVALRKRQDNGEDTNEIKGYKKTGQSAGMPQQSTPAPTPANEPAPWEV